MIGDAIEFIRPGVVCGRHYEIAADGTIAIWRHNSVQPTQAEIAAAELPAAKAQRIAAINADCRARLIARFGTAEEQVSRAIGIYGATEQTALETGIGATIDASNTASNAVLAAADVAAVEAVTVSWPAI